MSLPRRTQAVIVGAGFSGLSTAYELSKRGVSVIVLEADREIGGLASAFDIGETKLERFYHHWFTNDIDVMDLIKELGLDDRIEIRPTNTGVYYAHRFHKLSTPLDLLRFRPLAFTDRIRLGLLAIRARRVKDWKSLEHKSASEWLCELGGKNVYRVVWQPLLNGKFGPYAEQVSAVWFWNKLKLRGSSRGKGGEERLVYFNGGFIALADAIGGRIRALGGHIEIQTPALKIEPAGRLWRVETPRGAIIADRVIATPALPLIADLIRGWAHVDYVHHLTRVSYLCNVCLILILDRSLSDIYWLNVNDPSFPFVGVIEHTNFKDADAYAGRHIVYLSRYMPDTDPLYSLAPDEFLSYALPFLRKMFPQFDDDWIQEYHLWRARWAQPLVTKNYSQYIPAADGPREGFHICSMAQIYPEDRGTNYAIRDGRRIGARLATSLGNGVQLLANM